MSHGAIHRDVHGAARRSHDLIVIGGGIYGACVALEAARRGRRPLLLEQADFGGGVSRASLRIIHGGLRYLQSLDLRRSRESAREQRWFLAAFPDLVRPLACIMPLDGRGLRRPWAFRSALALARALGQRPCADDRAPVPAPGVLAPEEAWRWLGALDLRSSSPAGVWHDAVMTCPERVLIEIIRWACACGTEALNYVEVTDLLTGPGGAVAGVRAQDVVAGDVEEFRAPVVINCAGPSCAALANRLDRTGPDRGDLFAPSLAFNLLLDVPPPCNAAVAVRRDAPGSRTYFLVPCAGRVLAGTFHDACAADCADPRPTEAQIARFIADLRAAAPGLGASRDCVLAVLSGLLPAHPPGTARQAERPRIVHHADLGGPRDLWSVSGVKYTTARAVAERVVSAALPAPRHERRPPADTQRPATDTWPGLLDPRGPDNGPEAAAHIRRIAATESVVHLDDLVLRRTAWGLVPADALAAGRTAAAMLGWDRERCERELRRLARAVGLPSTAATAQGPAPTPTARAVAAASGVGAPPFPQGGTP